MVVITADRGIVERALPQLEVPHGALQGDRRSGEKGVTRRTASAGEESGARVLQPRLTHRIAKKR